MHYTQFEVTYFRYSTKEESFSHKYTVAIVIKNLAYNYDSDSEIDRNIYEISLYFIAIKNSWNFKKIRINLGNFSIVHNMFQMLNSTKNSIDFERDYQTFYSRFHKNYYVGGLRKKNGIFLYFS